MNKVCLVGRLVKDPELRSTESGIKCVSTNIAINNGKDKDGNERKADFPKIVVFNEQAENLVKYQKKGNLIGVEGRVKTRTWDKQDGTKAYDTYIVADRVEFLSTKPKEEMPLPEPDYVPSSEKEMTTQTTTQPATQTLDEIAKEDDPFKEFANETMLTDEDFPFN